MAELANSGIFLERKLFSNHVYHEYKGKQVIGYVCGDEPPQ